jgi:hypothetical protein
MSRQSAANAVATPRNDPADRFHRSGDVETAGKSCAFDCLCAVVDGCGTPRKALAEDCGLSESYFSKVISGKQGDVFALLDKRPMRDIRAEWYRRLSELEHTDPVDAAAEQLTLAALRWLRLRAGRPRMAKASLPEESR